MLATTLNSSFANQGQICLCGSRIFIERKIYDKFKTDFVANTKALTVGNPLDENTKVGAIVSKPHQQKILSYVELAKQEGGKILCGGNEVKLSGELSEGYYIEPTIIEGLAYDCRTNPDARRQGHSDPAGWASALPDRRLSLSPFGRELPNLH